MDAVVLQRADEFEAGAVADVGEARVLVAAEVPLEDLAVRRAVEDRAPGFEFADAGRRFLGVELGHPPVVDVLPAAHGVGEVDLPVVAVIDVGERRGDAALGHHGVRLAEQRLADEADGHARGAGLDGGAKPRAAGADHDDVVFVSLVVHRHRARRVNPAESGDTFGVRRGRTPRCAQMIRMSFHTPIEHSRT